MINLGIKLAPVLLMAFMSCNNTSDKAEVRKIEVTGSAQMEIVPNEIHISFTLTEFLNAGRAKVGLEKIQKDFTEACKAAGIPDSNVTLAGYSGQDRWDYHWYRRRKTEPQFLRSVQYLVKVGSTDLAEKIIMKLDDQAVENFYISKTTHSNLEKLRQEVKMGALVAAKNKAKFLADGIGENIGEALLIQEIDRSEQSDRRMYSTAAPVSNQEMVEQGATVQDAAGPAYQKILIRYEMIAHFQLK